MSKYSYENTKPKLFPQGINTGKVKIEMSGGSLLVTVLSKRDTFRPTKKGLKEAVTFLEKNLVLAKIKGKNKLK